MSCTAESIVESVCSAASTRSGAAIFCASNLSINAMGRRYLSTLLAMFFQRVLIADDILEERLAERAQMIDRLKGVDDRVGDLEAAVSELRKAALPGRAASEPNATKDEIE